jgi:hypothetical protein
MKTLSKSPYLLIFLCATAAAQQFSSDTSFVKPRGRFLYVGSNPKPLIRLFDPQHNLEVPTNPRFGQFVPMLSLSADSSKAVVMIRRAGDSHAYTVIDIATGNWKILPGEAARVYWSADSRRLAIYERFLSDLQKIRIIDFSQNPFLIYTGSDIIKPSDQEGKKCIEMKDFCWDAQGVVLQYVIATTDSIGNTKKVAKQFHLPETKAKE